MRMSKKSAKPTTYTCSGHTMNSTIDNSLAKEIRQQVLVAIKVDGAIDAKRLTASLAVEGQDEEQTLANKRKCVTLANKRKCVPTAIKTATASVHMEKMLAPEQKHPINVNEVFQDSIKKKSSTFGCIDTPESSYLPLYLLPAREVMVSIKLYGYDVAFKRKAAAVLPLQLRVTVKVHGKPSGPGHPLIATIDNSTYDRMRMEEESSLVAYIASKRGRSMNAQDPVARTILSRKQSESRRLDMARDAKAIATLFPTEELKLMKSDSVGNSNEDYGGKYSTLNFPTESPHGQMHDKLGQATLGWMYENDQKLKAYKGHSRCHVSERNLSYLLTLRRSLCKKVDPRMLHVDADRQISVMDTMRVSAIKGAKTKAHTDSLRGITPSYVMFHDGHGALNVRRFPCFRTSIVSLQGKKFVPFHYSDVEGLQMLGLSETEEGRAQRFEFPKCVLDMLMPVGDLEFAVVGIKAGDLQIIPYHDRFKIIRSPADLPTISMGAAIQMAEMKSAVLPTPHQMSYTFTRTHVWHEFESWRFIHSWLDSGNHLVARTHVFFRPLREVPTSANYIRVGKSKNYVSCNNNGIPLDNEF